VGTWHSFVAVGDSFSEGLDDPYPDGETYRGWADLVAAALAESTPDFGYANLAIRGRKLGEVVGDQVPAALELEPDLVRLSSGGNDILRPTFAAIPLIKRFDAAVGRLRRSGADVILFRFTDFSRFLPLRALLKQRIALLNDVAIEAAAQYGAYLVDLESDSDFENPRLWSADRLHMSPAGHRRVAAHVLTTLGLTPDPAWLAAPEAAPTRSWATTRVADLAWAREHLTPWMTRRLRRGSSGDGLAPKRPQLAPITMP
jgi:lysophospholipase L1-like esterase